MGDLGGEKDRNEARLDLWVYTAGQSGEAETKFCGDRLCKVPVEALRLGLSFESTA
ncbi:MAG: hypothetical protein HC781_05895 [Leptolyngbyaceae cyanobacterium CSU_1_4]|nr:hypothetical protein [Leptolyngbyaceae cyanobacterium CSU_1_4]